MQDLIIIGGGPAGLSAALTARNRNKSVLVITGSMADSGLWKAGRITNYPGTPDIPGKELLEQMTQQARVSPSALNGINSIQQQLSPSSSSSKSNSRVSPQAGH